MKKVTNKNSLFVKIMALVLAGLMVFSVVAALAGFLAPQIENWITSMKSAK